MSGRKVERLKMLIREMVEGDEEGMVRLIAGFRMALAEVRGQQGALDLAAAREELETYYQKEYPIYVADQEEGVLLGYLVCRLEGTVVWAESIYVDPGYRQQGVGSALYEKAEALAESLGGDPPYNWVDPENEAIIRFLQRRGYSVLNLVELRKPRDGETGLERIVVGNHSFKR